MKLFSALVILAFALSNHHIALSQITTIWLTHKTNDPSRIVVNWESKEPGNSEVYFGTDTRYGQHIKVNEAVTLHHIEIPLSRKDVNYHFMVKTGSQVSDDKTFKAYPSALKELRVAVVANLAGYSGKADLSAITRDDPHLLITCGDNVPDFHTLCGPGVKDCVKPYSRLIAARQQLFSSTPFMPVLGNHDKEIRPRGTRFPEITSYDIDATAYRKFFELPDDEWKWHFRIPDFNVTFFALDINHISDFGTTWQTCHDFRRGSAQFEWYRKMIQLYPEDFKITLQNERNGSIRAQENGEWDQLFQKGTAVITGYGHFSERAEVDGFPYFNTSLVPGNIAADPYSKVLHRMHGYVLLTFKRGYPMKVEIKSLDGTTVDTSTWEKR